MKFDDESSDTSDANYSSSEESSAHVTSMKKVSLIRPDPGINVKDVSG